MQNNVPRETTALKKCKRVSAVFFAKRKAAKDRAAPSAAI